VGAHFDLGEIGEKTLFGLDQRQDFPPEEGGDTHGTLFGRNFKRKNKARGENVTNRQQRE